MNIRGFFTSFHPQLCPYVSNDVILRTTLPKKKKQKTPVKGKVDKTPAKKKAKKTPTRSKKPKKTLGVGRRSSKRLGDKVKKGVTYNPNE